MEREKIIRQIIETPVEKSAEIPHIKNKQDLIRLYNTIQEKSIWDFDDNKKTSKKYVKKWNLYERFIRKLDLQAHLN